MAIRKILVAPHPVLKEVAEPVTEITAEIKELMQDMLDTMYAAPGVGLAAPQIGILKRVIVVDVANPNEGEAPAPIKLANPEIVWTNDDEEIDYEEGCLSLPGYFEFVTRPSKCRVKGLNENGEEVEIEAEDLLSVCLQHEIDHLNGTLFVDHLSRLRRDRVMNKLKKDKLKHKLKAEYPIEE